MDEEVDIFIVEDNVPDVELYREAFKDLGVPCQIQVVWDGEQAIQALANRKTRPHVILLDLNLPKLSGLELLKILKKDPQFRMVPVMILTNSTAQDDITRCYSHHANAYIRKPVGYDKLVETFRHTWQFWTETALIPRPGMPALKTIPPSSKRR